MTYVFSTSSIHEMTYIKLSKIFWSWNEGLNDALHHTRISDETVLARKKIEIAYAWVPGQAGVRGNEIADKLAREASNNTNIEVNLDLSPTEAKTIIGTACKRKWDEEFTSSDTAAQYKTYHPSVLSHVEPDLSRKYSRLLIRIQTGHCKLNSDLSRIGCHVTGLCFRCQVLETVEHFILECRSFENERSYLFHCADRLGIPRDLKAMLSDSHYRSLIC